MNGSAKRELLLIFGPFCAVALVAALGWLYAPSVTGAIRQATYRGAKWLPPSVRGPFAQTIDEANAAHDAKDYARAIALYSAALTTAPIADKDRRDLLQRRATEYEWAEQYAEAEADLTTALAIQPLDPAIYRRRGSFYERRKRYDDALADFAAGMQLSPSDPGFHVGEGDVRFARQEYAAAIGCYNEALRLRPGTTEALMGRAAAYGRQESFAKARADYDAVLADLDRGPLRQVLIQEITRARIKRGYVNLRLGEYARAKDDFDKVLAVRTSRNALQWRGYALESLGDRDGALADYRAVLAIAPDEKWVAKRVQALTAVR